MALVQHLLSDPRHVCVNKTRTRHGSHRMALCSGPVGTRAAGISNADIRNHTLYTLALERCSVLHAGEPGHGGHGETPATLCKSLQKKKAHRLAIEVAEAVDTKPAIGFAVV